MNELPYHLRPDVPPLAECGRCHRKSWTLDEIGQEDRMTQPDGYPCGGTMEPRPFVDDGSLPALLRGLFSGNLDV